MADIAVIIPTRDRPDSLAKALESVAVQTKCPDFVVVISDCDSTFEIKTNTVVRNIVEKFAKIECIRNRRTKNLSGAINTGLACLIESGVDPESTFIALLDDDDEWEPDYLKKCMEIAEVEEYDLVVSGLIRHESETDIGTPLSIPTSLSTHDFFVGNPHIQGSNLFVHFSTLLQVGGFDEALESTTDRDVCIRLLDIGTLKVGFIPIHLVHHWALPNQDRLSSPGSERKQNGLRIFYWKYAPRMSSHEKEAFKKRAYDLFGCIIEEPNLITCAPREDVHQLCSPTGVKNYPIVVGFIATRMDSTKNLLDDLVTFFKSSDAKRAVVIYDNTRSTAQLKGLIEHSKYADLNCMMIDAGTIEKESEEGVYGNYLVESENRNGIASGRTVLHHILYRESKKYPGAVIWVLDDDIRLEKVERDGMVLKITFEEVQQAILHMKEQGISIANGQVTGDAPIPAHSMLRTQLLDLHSHLKMYEAEGSLICKQADILSQVLTKYPDYYYDYSDLHTAHLEIPFWTEDDSEKLIRRIIDIKSGINLFRQVVVTEPESRFYEGSTRTIPPRGGNTMVLNSECLRMFPNISPRINDTNVRRGDTFWCILNDRVKGQIVGRFPIALRQERTHEAGSKFNLDTLRADFYGSAFIRSMDAYYIHKIEETGVLPRRIRLAINDEDIDLIIDTFRTILTRRLNRFIENAYRIWGLCNAIGVTLNAKRFSQHDENKVALRFIQELKEIYSPQEIWQFYETTMMFQEDDLKTFLRNFHEFVKSYRCSLEPEVHPDSIEHAHGIITLILKKRNESHLQKLRYLGHGNEGVVFTDGKRAYKYFFTGKANFQDGRLNFIRDHLLNNSDLQHICQLHEIVEDAGELVFIMEYAEGSEYKGDHLKDILALLDECRYAGIAFTNFHPKNLIITKDGLKLIDLGDSFVPWNEQEYIQMCRRAYLAYRWHFRDDLSKLMSQALFNSELPELAGFEYFFNATQKKHKSAVLDERIILIASEGGPCSVLDYGCGRGVIAEPLVKQGFDVTGYDIDASVLGKNLKNHHSAQYICRNELLSLKEIEKNFSKIICSLVLCTIEDDDEITDVVSDLRTLVTDDGEAIVSLCNPFYTFTNETETHIKIDLPEEHQYHDKFVFRKQMKETGKIRTEVHRPFSFYKHLFHKCGFEIMDIEEIKSTDIQQLCPSSDFLICRLKPLKIPDKKSVSLLIRAGAMEWQTIDFQIRHIIRQLQGPQSFVETVVVTDMHDGPFSRQYTKGNLKNFQEKLDKLMSEGVIDRVIVAPESPLLIEETYNKWFGIRSSFPWCENGQPTFMALYGIEQCVGDYVLQLDSDCLICRLDRNHDYLNDMISVFEQDPDALTVSFNIAHEEDQPYNATNSGGKWRTEVRCSLIDKMRVKGALPMPNGINSKGILMLPWHRSMDLLLKNSKKQSYRGGNQRTFFIHVPNDRKIDPNEWYTIMCQVERGQIPQVQYGNVNLHGSFQDWTGVMNQEYMFIVRGQNVPIPKIRRCVDSLAKQQPQNFGIVFIDADSSNAMGEYIRDVLLCDWSNKSTYLGNSIAITPLENHDIAIRKICSNPDSVIITLDADDALISKEVIKHLDEIYKIGADLSVGSMLRTDKFVRYPVTFTNPRGARGGNVWQHLRSFKKYLYDAIPEDYLQINGNWIPYAEDWAFMIPMVEMAKKPMYITEPLYFYEPRGGKNEQMRAIREELIHKIISKPTLLPVIHQKGMKDNAS